MSGGLVADGERVTLRTLEREDLAFVQRATTEPAIRHPLGSVVRNRDELEGAFEDGEDTRLLVCLDGDDAGPTPDAVDGDRAPDAGETRRVGAVRIESTDWKRPELSYWLVPAIHGEGYGTESVGVAVDFTFRSRGVPAVAAGVSAHNDASRRLLESLGFREEWAARRADD